MPCECFVEVTSRVHGIYTLWVDAATACVIQAGLVAALFCSLCASSLISQAHKRDNVC
jgi:hypothetical protein